MEQAKINQMVRNTIATLRNQGAESLANANYVYKGDIAPFYTADTDDIVNVLSKIGVMTTDVAMQLLRALHDNVKYDKSHDEEYNSRIMSNSNRQAYDLDIIAHENVDDDLSGRIFWDSKDALLSEMPTPLNNHDLAARFRTYLTQNI